MLKFKNIFLYDFFALHLKNVRIILTLNFKKLCIP